MPVQDEPYLRDKPILPAIEACWIGIEPYTLGANSYVGTFSHIAQNTIIGKFCSISNLCTIGAQKHNIGSLTSFPFMELTKAMGNQSTVISNDVWVGSNSVIMSGLNVGHGAVIGAGSVVTKDVPHYAIVVGSPAKVLRYRFPPDLIRGLLETAWWDLPADVIRTLPLNDPWACVALIRGMDKQKPVL